MRLERRLVVGMWMLATLLAVPAAAQQVTVTSAEPSSGEQDTASLDVRVKGKGFGAGAQAKFYLDNDEVTGGTEFGKRGGALNVSGVDDDLSAAVQLVEHARRVAALSHPQTQSRVIGISESVHLLQRDDRGWVSPCDGVVEYAAAADGRQLVSVSNERNAGPGLVGDRQECSGRVLIEHPGLVDQQEITGPQECRRIRCRVLS